MSDTFTEDPASPPDDGPQPREDSAPVDLEPGAGPVEDLEEDIELEAPELPVVDDEEELEPKTLPVERLIGPDEKGRTAEYTQKGLSYFGKIELYGLLGRAVEVAMEKDMGINDLMDLASPQDLISKMMTSLPGADTAPDADENTAGVDEAGKMLAAFAKVVSFAPEMLMEAYCIILAVPKGHRKWALDWGLPTIDDEMGEDILHTFIDQNWGVMEDFFTRGLPKVMKRAAQARKRHQASAGGPSKR